MRNSFVVPIISIRCLMRLMSVLILIGAVLALFLLPGAARSSDQGKVPVAKDKDDPIDYENLLNDKLGAGVTPEKNANVLLWKALGPTPEGGDGLPSEFFRRMSMQEPPKEGKYFISLTKYLPEQGIPAGEVSRYYDQQGLATKRPWDAKTYPQIAAWLKTNEKPLELVLEAVRRPDYFNPLVSRRQPGQPGMIMGALLPSVQKCRELATALAARAMLETQTGRLDDAWRGLQACHRLGRLVARGGTLIEELVGIAIDQIATNADLAYLEAANLPAKTILDRLKDLEDLPPMPSLADKIDLTERFTMMQLIQMIRRDGGKTMGGLTGQQPRPLTDEEKKAWATLDWAPALKATNAWYDRAVAAMRIEDRAARLKEFDRFEADLAKVTKATKSRDDKVINKLLTEEGITKALPQRLADVLIGLLMPAFRKVTDAQDRSIQNQRNLEVAFALAAYKGTEGKYPAKLADLAPKYLARVPDDLFSGKPLIYKLADGGYMLYSVGVNGKDDGGRSHEDMPQGDDLVVRMPLPPLKKN